MAPATLEAYRHSAAGFVSYLERHGWFPGHAAEWDDLIVEYSFVEGMEVSHIRFCYAALECCSLGFAASSRGRRTAST